MADKVTSENVQEKAVQVANNLLDRIDQLQQLIADSADNKEYPVTLDALAEALEAVAEVADLT